MLEKFMQAGTTTETHVFYIASLMEVTRNLVFVPNATIGGRNTAQKTYQTDTKNTITKTNEKYVTYIEK